MADGETYCIRSVVPNDLDGLIELCGEHAAYEGTPYDPRGKREGLFQALFSAEPRLNAWVVAQNSHLVGYATACQEFSTWDAAPFLHMDCLYLRETIRGLGIGQRLFSEVVHLAHQCGYSIIQWQTPTWNERAHNFYRRLGAEGKHKVRYSISAGNG